ncbi:MAG: Rv3654c family TadE-like protein [Sciscionella sp.]
MSGRVVAASGRSSAERGSATIWTVAGIAVVFLIAAVIVMVGSATVTRHRVESAADLSALAAAAYAPTGEQFACRRARWVARHMGTTLRSCRLSGWDALVVASAKPSALSGLPVSGRTVTSHARAGPVIR